MKPTSRHPGKESERSNDQRAFDVDEKGRDEAARLVLESTVGYNIIENSPQQDYKPYMRMFVKEG